GGLCAGSIGGWGLGAALASAGLALAGFWVDRRRGLEQAAARDATAAYVTGTDQVGRDVLPLWSAHIEQSRAQMEEAIAALSHRFGGIVERLDQALKASVQGGDQGLAGVFSHSRAELQGVLESL